MASNKKTDNKTAQRITELDSEDVKVRKEAALWLGRKGAQEAFVPLLKALQDSSWKVRRNAALALGKTGNREAVIPLIASLSDRTLSVKRAAIHALGTLRDPRATDSLMRFHSHTQLGPDTLQALIRIGAPALLYCCQQMQSESLTIRNLGQETAHKMIRLDADTLLKEALSVEGWNGQQRWMLLEAVRTAQSTLSFFDLWFLSKFSRIPDIPNWCERIIRDPAQVTLHAGTRQVLDYLMLGRASQRDHSTESEELLRASAGTQNRDTGETLLRASDNGTETAATPSLRDRLRRWFARRSA